MDHEVDQHGEHLHRLQLGLQRQRQRRLRDRQDPRKLPAPGVVLGPLPVRLRHVLWYGYSGIWYPVALATMAGNTFSYDWAGTPGYL
jgi:hypothetical protein